MSYRIPARRKLGAALGLATASLLFAASVHAQTATGSSADNQSGRSKSGQMAKQNSESAASSSTPSDNGKSTSGSSQSAGAAGASSAAAGAAAGNESRTASKSSDAKDKLSKGDRDMMVKIAQANMAEIEAGKLAEQKTQSEEVRKFAQKMIEDHTKAQSELEKIAQAKGVTLPSKPDKAHQAAMKKLSGLSDAEFDKRYMMQAGLSDHQNTHRLLERVSKEAKDEDLKQYASKTIEAVDQHWKMAKEAHGSKGSRPAGSSGSGTSKSAGSSGKSGSGSDNSSEKASSNSSSK